MRQIEIDKRMPKSELPAEIMQEEVINTEPEVQFLYQCISELPELDRIIISLELEELKQKEIAKIVGLSESNVRVRIHRIKEKLTLKFQQNAR